MSDDDNKIIERMLEPVSKYWAARSDSLVEVSINGPGEVWLQHKDRGYERVRNADVTKEWASELCRVLANTGDRRFDRLKPILGIQLPGGHRLQAILGPNVLSRMALSIRVRRREQVELGSFGYGDDGGLPPLGAGLVERQNRIAAGEKITVRKIADVIAAGGSAVVSGATGSGKTTFLRALLRRLPDQARVITVEDVEELTVPHENAVQFLVSRSGTGTEIEYPEVIDACMRLNPDTVIPGEISIHNAEAVYRLLNTGHGSFLTSIHANSCLDALDAFRRNIEMRTGRSADAAIPFIAKSIDVFVHLSHRRIVEAGRGCDLAWQQLVGGAPPASGNA